MNFPGTPHNYTIIEGRGHQLLEFRDRSAGRYPNGKTSFSSRRELEKQVFWVSTDDADVSGMEVNMGKKINQHFVPQFYFRQFSGGANCIQAFFPAQSRIIRDAPIKGQCASAKFYGDDEAETVLSGLEAQYAAALRSMIVAAWSDHPISRIEPAALRTVREFIMVQRARTRSAVNQSMARSSAWMMEGFKHWLASSADLENQRMRAETKSHPCDIEMHGPAIALQSIAIAMMTEDILSDLDFCIFRNHTDFPFIFCDAPVIFHNTYYHNVRHRGVLGAATPGLQIFVPLNAHLAFMLYDEKAYECTYHDDPCVDLFSKCDVSQINALQIHAFDQAVYFDDHEQRDYVTDLWKSHGPSRRKPTKLIHEHGDWLLDNLPVKGLLHQFEPLHNIRLDLSFLKCTPIEEKDYVPGKRDPELAEFVDERLEREFEAADAEHAEKMKRTG